MIDIKDVRIGNWIDISDSSTLWRNLGEGKFETIIRAVYGQVSSINSNSSPYILAGGFHCLDNGKYIPLTTDILVKCGFENDGSEEYSLVVNRAWVFLFSEEKQFRIADFNDDYYKNKCDIKYLHQLQNLYFALTNSELEINL